MSDRLPLAVVAGCALALHLAHVWKPIPVLLDAHLVDDAFYYLQVAWNASELGFPSLDGVHPTNGFHPLFMGLLLGLKPLAGGDRELFVHLALTVLSVVHVLTAVLLALATEHILGSARAALAPALVWLAWPVTFTFPLMGLETSLAACCTSAAFLAYLHLDGSGWRSAALGSALALAVLARTDAVFLVAAVGVALAVRWLASGRRLDRAVLRRTLALHLPLAALVGAYVGWNTAVFEHPVPMSGRVKSVLSLERSWTPDMTLGDRIAGSVRWGIERRGRPRERRYLLATLALASLLALEGAAALSCRHRGRGARWIRTVSVPPARPWLAAAVGVHLYYILLQGYYGSVWYLLQFAWIGSLYGGMWIARSLLAAGWTVPRAAWLLAPLALAPNQIEIGPERSRLRPTRFQYDVARWIGENLPAGARVGSLNAGTLAYFCSCRVTNLDGLINNAAGAAILRHELDTFVEGSDLEYLADYRGSLAWSNRFGRRPWVTALFEPVVVFGNPTTWEQGSEFVLLARRAPEAGVAEER